MTSNPNQTNKALVWDLWQRLNHAPVADAPALFARAMRADIDFNASAPIDQLIGIDALISDFWLPLRRAFPDLKRQPYIFMGGVESGDTAYVNEAGGEWVSGCGYLHGTFVDDWLGIPATGKKTFIHFGEFYRMRDGKIAEVYAQYDILALMRASGFQVLPPAFGAEGGKIPGPHAKDGILLMEQDALESRRTLQLVEAMLAGLRRYDRARDGDNMRAMEGEKYWHRDMKWYGPSGIGACFTLQEFEDFHQRPWLHGYGDREISLDGGGATMGFVGEGLYACGGIWDTVFSRHNGEYAGIPATGKWMTIRDFDWWKRDGDWLIENWVPIDMIDLCRQMGVDLMGRLREQVEARAS